MPSQTSKNNSTSVQHVVKVNGRKPTELKPLTYFKGIIKKVLSGDAVIIRGLKAIGGPPSERLIHFSNVIAPKLAKKANNSQSETKDEPCAWMAREFLRKKLIGKQIHFTVEIKAQSGVEYGTVYLRNDCKTLMNVTEMMVSEGLLTVRRESIRSESKLTRLEDDAKAKRKGKWGPAANTYVRDVKWYVDDLEDLVDKADGKPVKAIIEHVRDGSTVRLLLLQDYYHVTLMISGIRCPMFKVDLEEQGKKANADPYAEEARYFVEAKLLHREVEIYLETYNNNNLVGSIIHPNGNIAEVLLKEGYAKCFDRSMGTVTGGAEKLRTAEKLAKTKKLRMWKDYEPSTTQLSVAESEFEGRVTEVVNGDALFIKKNNGEVQKVFLSSIIPPRLDDTVTNQPQKISRPLYDIPWRYEAREFLRKKLIGQMVHVTVDYVLPAQYNFPKKVCCTVKIGDVNVSHEMVSKGLASVLFHKQEESRSSCYDDLLSAEAKARREEYGLHSKKNAPIHNVIDISERPSIAPNLLSVLNGAGKTEAIVEHVASGSRMRLYIPREACLITFLLGGIICPKVRRAVYGGVCTVSGDPFGAEALEFMKDQILQREVQLEVNTMDEGCNFIGWLHFENQNMSVQLVKNGLSTVHRTAEGTRFSQELYNAEQTAKEMKLNIWTNFSESENERPEESQPESRIDQKSMVICGVTTRGRIFGQCCSDGPALETLMGNLSKELAARPPVAGAYSPRRGDLCAARFVDGNWYRAKVEKVSGGQVNIFYIDYGNREITTSFKLAPLASQFISQPGYAHEFSFALTKFPREEHTIEQLISYLMSPEYEGKVVKVNLEYKVNGIDFCSVQRVEDESDVAKTLLSQGLLLVRDSKDKRLEGLLLEYKAAQEEARRKHLNIWQ